MPHDKTPLMDILTSREVSPLLEAMIAGQKKPLKHHRHNPSLWWQNNRSNQPDISTIPLSKLKDM